MQDPFLSTLSLQRLLLGAGIPSIVIGGVAVAAWGEPRLTRDVDLKILLDRQDADRLLEILSAGYTPLVSNPRETLRKQAMIFIQDEAGIRFDLLLAETPYDLAAVQRGRFLINKERDLLMLGEIEGVRILAPYGFFHRRSRNGNL